MAEDDIVRELNFSDKVIRIHQQSVGDVNSIVWDSALVCCHYFAKCESAFRNLKVVELGAGTAICSIVLASLGCDVTATDLPSYLPLVEKNISANSEVIAKSGGSCVAKPLDWTETTEERRECDLLLLVDCIYYVSSIDPLIQTIRSFNAKRILCAYEVRDCGQPVDAQRLFSQLITKHYDVQDVPTGDLDPLFQCPEILVQELVPKIDSV